MISNRVTVTIFVLSFLPFVLLKNGWATSYALGYTIFITCLWIMSYLHQDAFQNSYSPKSLWNSWWSAQSRSSLGLIGAVLLILSLQGVFLPIANGQRFVLSSALIFYFLLAASWFSRWKLPPLRTLQVFAKVFLGAHLVILLIYKSMGVLYLYPEPSHLSLAVIPWFTLMFLTVGASTKKWVFGLLIVFAALSTNTTIVVYMLLALIWVRPPLILLIVMVIYILFFNEQQLIERLSLNKAIFPCHTVIGIAEDGYLPAGCPVFVSTSTLVWLKGWHLAYLNFLETTGWGIGFQQLGYTGAYSMISESIRTATIGSVDLNIQDGGSLGAKMLSEMGLGGLVFLLYTVIVFTRYLYIVSRPHFFWVAAFIGGLFELYIRGYGYFTLNFVAYLAASIFFHRELLVQMRQKK